LSGFSDALVVEVLTAERDGRVTAKLLQGFSFTPSEPGAETISVPVGFVTDFASVPWGFWNIEPPLGQSGRAAVVHDYLYATRGLDGRYSRAQADAIFREALGVLGVARWKRRLLWAAVRVGGRGGWGR
jgi:hypothetical protein